MGDVIRAKLAVNPSHKFAFIVSRFNSFITEQLLYGAKDAFIRQGGSEEQITVVYVPGSMEIPLAAKCLAESRKYNAIICLGAVIRGQTPHFEYVASESAKGISKVSLKTGIPVIYGLVTADTLEQAIDRAGLKAGNKGAEAVLAGIEMANLLSELSSG